MIVRRTASMVLAAAVSAGLVVASPARPVHAAVSTVTLATHSFGAILADPGSSQVFISSPKEGSILVFDLAGNLLTTITGETGAGSMLVHGSTLYVSLSSGAIDRIDTSTRAETSTLVTGLTSPGDLAYASGLIWTTTGTPGSIELASIDPTAVTPTPTTYAGAFDSTNHLVVCAHLAVNHAPNPGYLIAFSCSGYNTIERFDVSGATPAQTATVTSASGIFDAAVSDDGSHLLATFGPEVDEYNVADLSLDGLVYPLAPGVARTTALATTTANGSKMVLGSDAASGANSFFAYPIGDPAQRMISATLGSVIYRGIAISPDGLTAYAIGFTLGLDPPNLWLNLVPLPALPNDGTPAAPTAVTATAGVGAAIISWTAPAYYGTSVITGYKVSSSGGATVTVGSTTFTTLMAGLSPVAHTFTVQAINASGLGVPSAPSNVVTPADGGTFNVLSPTRILDTRTGNGGFPIRRVPASGWISLQVTGRGGVPSKGVSAVVMNLTATDTTGPGFVTAYPNGFPRPNASNLNYRAGMTVPNLVEVAVGVSGRVNLFVGGAAADLVADVAGWAGDSTDSYFQSGLYEPSAPLRLYDSRYISTANGYVHQPLGPNQSITIPVYTASSPQAVILNVTATAPTRAGFLTVYPAGTPRPLASNLNFVPGQTVPNRVVVGVGVNSSITITNGPGTVDVVVDYNGAFGSFGSPFVPVIPTRFFDTRICRCKMPAATIYNFQLTGGAVSTGIAFNTTVTNPTATGFLIVYGDQGQGFNAPVPDSSDMNFTPGLTVANFTPLGMSGTSPQGFNVLNGFGSTDVILDEDGFYGVSVPGLVTPPSGPGVPIARSEPRAAATGPRVSAAPRVAST